jgi:hypothetical protein
MAFSRVPPSRSVPRLTSRHCDGDFLEVLSSCGACVSGVSLYCFVQRDAERFDQSISRRFLPRSIQSTTRRTAQNRGDSLIAAIATTEYPDRFALSWRGVRGVFARSYYGRPWDSRGCRQVVVNTFVVGGVRLSPRVASPSHGGGQRFESASAYHLKHSQATSYPARDEFDRVLPAFGRG